MVEVAENNVNTLVLFAEKVLGGDLDVVKGDVGGTSGGRVRSLDGLGRNTLATLDQEHTQVLASANTSDEVVAEGSVGDPLLGTVDNLQNHQFYLHKNTSSQYHVTYVVLAIRCLLCGRSQASDVRAGKSFGNGEAELLLAAEYLIGNLLLPGLVVSKVEDASKTNGHTSHVAVLEASHHGAGHLLTDNEVVEVVKLLALDGAVHQLNTV